MTSIHWTICSFDRVSDAALHLFSGILLRNRNQVTIVIKAYDMCIYIYILYVHTCVWLRMDRSLGRHVLETVLGNPLINPGGLRGLKVRGMSWAILAI